MNIYNPPSCQKKLIIKNVISCMEYLQFLSILLVRSTYLFCPFVLLLQTISPCTSDHMAHLNVSVHYRHATE